MTMNVTITGIGIWASGLESWEAFRRAVENGFSGPGAPFTPPRPEAIPARERRRAGLTINMAVEVMHQACAMAGEPLDGIGSVFASAMGDTDVTDYMCRKLATPEKLLSPTRFHNSVHNAPSGYWSISAANRQPSSFVGGYRDSFACGLLEAASTALAENLAVGLAVYDVANAAPFHDVLPITENLALALVMVPGARAPGWHLKLTLKEPTGVPDGPVHPELRRMAAANPAGAGLALLEALAGNRAGSLTWPLGTGTDLVAELSPGSTGC